MNSESDKYVSSYRYNNFTYAWRADENDVTYGKLQPAYTNKKISTIIVDKKEKVVSVKELINDFWSRTTIQGVSQIGTRKNLIWKFVWFFVTLSGAGMAMYQSRDVLQDYYGKSTVQKLSFKNKDAPFPAVTICKTIRIKQTSAESSGSSDEDPDHDLTINESYDPKDSIKYIRKCKFGTMTCNFSNIDDVFFWSNPKYGNCFTFNAGFNVVKTIDTAAGLNLIIAMNEFGDTDESDFTILAVHQSKTPPNLSANHFTVVNPRDLVVIKLKARELVKLVGSTECVTANDENWISGLVFNSATTPYIYTTPTCQKSCEIKRRERKFKCSDPSAVINATGKADNSYRRFCNYTEITYDIDQDYKTTCICPSACRETLLEEASKGQSTTVCKQTNVNDTTSCAVIKISYSNVPYEIIQEQRKYSDADFWGIIGGNVGLWVGICIISLLEVFELAFNICYSIYQTKACCNRKPKKIRVITSRLRQKPSHAILDKQTRGPSIVDIRRKRY